MAGRNPAPLSDTAGLQDARKNDEEHAMGIASAGGCARVFCWTGFGAVRSFFAKAIPAYKDLEFSREYKEFGFLGGSGRLIPAAAFSMPRVRKCVQPIQCLRVPKTCSTVLLRTVMA